VLTSAHEQSVPIFQQLARSDSSGRDDVRAIPAVAAQRQGSVGERGIDISHETVRFWWNRFGPMFAAEIRKRRVAHMRGYPQWRWHLDEVFVKINGKLCYLWRAVDHEGEVLEAVATAKRDKAAALKLLKRIIKKYGTPRSIVSDGLRAYSAAMNEIGVAAERHEVGRRLNHRAENSHQPFRRRERAMQRFRSMTRLEQ
jgi:putative transposase